MAFCGKCGAQVQEHAAFCGSCGQPIVPVATNPAVPATADTGMSENVAGLLCYAVGWITGLIFYFIDKRPFVRFHAAQSIVVFGGLQIVSLVLGWIFVTSFWVVGFGAVALLRMALAALEIVLWIVLMMKAYQGQRYRVPIAAGIAEGLAAKTV